MSSAFEKLAIGAAITGQPFAVSRETIKAFCEASLDHNPLHLDDKYMEGSFGKTQFGGVIMHGMTNFGLLTRMLTDWLLPMGGIHRRLETRWLVPVKPGDSIQPTGRVRQKKMTKQSQFVIVDVVMTNQRGEVVARGESTAEFPAAAA